MKKFFADFKDFAFKGNILDMAIGVIIGGAFGKIVSSLVADIISPLIGLLTGSITLSQLATVLKPEEIDAATGEVIKEALVLNYGSFLQSIIDFLIIALSIFIVLRIIMNAKKKFEDMRKKEEEETEEEAEDTELSVLLEIKELLEKKDAPAEAAADGE
ncbi:MAG: large-conductance mechanosensitive channel protein MscL [Clostridia bacterium]|nr:large-conductance mechanosensitive channel protein MscL [Clostridia bacterium]